MKTFTLPDLGEGLQDAEIVSWHVSAGDRVIADQPLVSVETEKAVVEVPAPWSGVVAKLYAEPGDVVAIGGPLADFDLDEKGRDAGAVVGDLPQAQAATAKSTPVARPRATASAKVKAMPAVRKLAADLGIDLALLRGSGPDGAISREDVLAASQAGVAPSAGDEWEPLRGVRRVMARNMAAAHAAVAATTVTELADVTHWAQSEDVTLRLVRAIAAGCAAEPELNVWYDADSQRRRVHQTIDLGIAMHTGDGLFVPVLRDAGNRPVDDLRVGLEAMKRDVSNRSVPPEELRGQTITLSNFGMVGGRHAALMVVPPQVAIVGAGRITASPRVSGDQVVPGRSLPLSLTFDHRAVAGVEAARFLMAIVNDLES
jgi:2-oxoisovalerate dehydrogenase E2 component (dihydrolipoyl transacylase)